MEGQKKCRIHKYEPFKAKVILLKILEENKMP